MLAATLVWGCHEPPPPTAPVPRAAALHKTTIVTSRQLGTLEVEGPDGERAQVRCANCHGMSALRDQPSVHGALKLAHGPNTCNACHSEGDRSTLHLADGQVIPFSQTMRLCQQCHGPQTRDYTRGSHGGMRGYWDLSRGPRTRNHCVNCHDPHRPAYPLVRPAAPPRDRFLRPAHADAHAETPSHPTDQGHR